MAALSFKDHSTTPPRAAALNLKLSHHIQNAIPDELDGIECHADEWMLPTLNPTVLSQLGRSSVDCQFECKLPSPLIHDISEEIHLPRSQYLQPDHSKLRHREETNGGGPPSIPIPKRIRRHRRTDSEIMVRLTDSEFELGPSGTVLVKTARDDELDVLLLPAAIDTFGSLPSSFFSSPPSRGPNITRSFSYAALIAQEIQKRADAKKRLDELGDDEKIKASEKGQEALRRMLWGIEISNMFPVECVRDFG